MQLTRLVLIFLLLSAVPLALADPFPDVPDAGVTRHADMLIPAKPIASQSQLDNYLHDTPASRSPLHWLTPAARKRFLDGLVFQQHDLAGMYLGDLSYELTGEQAYTLLRLFGAQSYALDLDGRSSPRAARASAETAVLEPGYNELAATAQEQRNDAASAVTKVYARHFSAVQTAAHRRTLSGRDVAFLFRATTLAFQVTHRREYLAGMQADFAELQRRRLVDLPYASDLFHALLLTGKTAEARSLRRTYPQLKRGPVPPMKTVGRVRQGQPSLWIVATKRGKPELQRYPFNMRASAQIIVLASTSCPYSEQAARAIEADPALREVFREHAQWVAPASELTAYQAIHAWNEVHDALRIGVIHDDNELTMVRRIETPTFYFLDHGRVVDTVIGWPEGGALGAIRRGLRKINLPH